MRTEVVEGDVLEARSLAGVMDGVDMAYYLIHSMAAGGDFEALDRTAAMNFADAARTAGIQRIIYLGGLAESGGELSSHLRSRQEVGEILRRSGAEVVELRASVIIGFGSLSFELVRALVERLAVMICPRWVRTLAQPIAIQDVLDYLIAGLDLPPGGGRIYEIGGPDAVSYADIMREYARQRGLSRLLIPVPVLTPWLSSLWLALVTPVYARIGRRLIEGVRNPSTVRDSTALSAFPGIRPAPLRQAIHAALADEDQGFSAKPMSEIARTTLTARNRVAIRFGNRILDSRDVVVSAPAQRAFEVIQRIGGRTGWYYADWLWQVRGWLDLLVGGPGMRRPRRDVNDLRVGDTIDCWRVVLYEPGCRLRLEAEMKLPGRAWLEFEVTGDERLCTIRQTAAFDPKGMLGLAYWYVLLPVHNRLLGGMLNAIGRVTEKLAHPS